MPPPRRDWFPEATAIYTAVKTPDPNRDLLVKTCKKYLESKHCTLWQNWLLEADKIEEDGTVTKKGLSNAAEWLADQIIAALALTVRTNPPYTTSVKEGAIPHG